jgi:hypothetical protein
MNNEDSWALAVRSLGAGRGAPVVWVTAGRRTARDAAIGLLGLVVAASGCTSASDGARDASAGSSGAGGSGGFTGVGPGGAGGSGGASDPGTGGGPAEDPCAGGLVGAASDSESEAGTKTDSFGFVEFDAPLENQIVALETTMIVPPSPPASGTLFLWPGLQPLPGGANYDVLDNGVLQPVLTWGPTCAPTAPAAPYDSWWISAQYVNTFITTASPFYDTYSGCRGGQGMSVTVGATLKIRMSLSGAIWSQTVTDAQSGAAVSFDIDMHGQAQHRAEFVIESYDRPPISDVVFTSTTITLASPEADACRTRWRGQSDYYAAPVSSRDGLRCCISRIVLRAEAL